MRKKWKSVLNECKMRQKHNRNKKMNTTNRNISTFNVPTDVSIHSISSLSSLSCLSSSSSSLSLLNRNRNPSPQQLPLQSPSTLYQNILLKKEKNNKKRGQYSHCCTFIGCTNNNCTPNVKMVRVPCPQTIA
jgi:hypothetical protein